MERNTKLELWLGAVIENANWGLRVAEGVKAEEGAKDFRLMMHQTAFALNYAVTGGEHELVPEGMPRNITEGLGCTMLLAGKRFRDSGDHLTWDAFKTLAMALLELGSDVLPEPVRALAEAKPSLEP